MSLFTTAKSQNAEIEALVVEFLKANAVTRVEKRSKRKGLTLASRHAGKPNYGRKARRYA